MKRANWTREARTFLRDTLRNMRWAVVTGLTCAVGLIVVMIAAELLQPVPQPLAAPGQSFESAVNARLPEGLSASDAQFILSQNGFQITPGQPRAIRVHRTTLCYREWIVVWTMTPAPMTVQDVSSSHRTVCGPDWFQSWWLSGSD